MEEKLTHPVVVRNVTKRFGAGAFPRHRGGFTVTRRTSSGDFGFVGPDGAGKSTMIRMLCTVVRPDSGMISIAGRDAVGNLEA